MNHPHVFLVGNKEFTRRGLIECTPKAAFRALDLKCSRPFPSDLKTDQEVLYKQGKLLKWFLKF